MAVKPIPEGYHSVTPYLIVQGAPQLIDFLKQAFDAVEKERMATPDGAIMHAEVKIGDSVVMMSDASPQNAPTSAMIHVYVNDVDAAYKRALQAGGSTIREPSDQFYGDRSGGVKDRFGNQWWIATHVEDVTPEEMAKRAQAAMSQQA